MKYKHFFFDMDGTLTESRQVISEDMIEMLDSIIALGNTITVISGASKEQMRIQLPINHINLLAQSGNDSPFWQRLIQYKEHKEIYFHIKRIRGMFPQYIGKDSSDLIQNRGSQVAFSFVGHNANIEEKKIFDPKGVLRNAVLKAIPLKSRNIEVRIGGTTCLDYTHKDYTKGKNIKRFINRMKWNSEECIYFGDALFEGGNDETVIRVIKTVEVKNPQDLLLKLKDYVRKNPKYIQVWRKKNIEKRREYNRNWMRNFRSKKKTKNNIPKIELTDVVVYNKKGHCKKCDILLKKERWGNKNYCIGCLLVIKNI